MFFHIYNFPNSDGYLLKYSIKYQIEDKMYKNGEYNKKIK